MFYLTLFLLELVILYFLSKKLAKNISQFLYRITKSKKAAIYFFSVLYLPGTFIHEISHFLFALVLLVPIGEIKFLPEMDEENQIKLGSIEIGKTDLVRRSLIGFAPLVAGIPLIFGVLWYVTSKNLLGVWWVIILTAYLIFQIANNMFSSRKDLEGIWVLGVLILIISIALYLLGVRVSLSSETMFALKLIQVLKQAVIYLLIPIGIDLGLMFFAKLIRR